MIVSCSPRFHTVLNIEGVGGQPEGGAAVVTLEAAAMEKLSLCAETLHHIDTLPTEETHIAASNILRELLPQRTLQRERQRSESMLVQVFLSESKEWHLSA